MNDYEDGLSQELSELYTSIRIKKCERGARDAEEERRGESHCDLGGGIYESYILVCGNPEPSDTGIPVISPYVDKKT
jgi:hypothetical protein